ncbi:MAG: peptidylprolyl isomerase [Bacteroidales bacterium]|nr:peptidylprolyl isomerase [Bacteroidales bacterium]
MATLENIRRRAGILIMAAIGLAMLGFILGDFNIRPSTKVAEINGETYGIEDYLAEKEVLMNFYKMNYGQNLDAQIEQEVEDETWRRMVRNSVMDPSYNNLGIMVSDDELKAMVAGNQSAGMGGGNPAAFNEPHPIIRQMFTNPETGEFNRYIMVNYFNSLDREEYAQERQRWLFIENEIIEERLNQKYMALLSKGLRPSSLDVRDYHEETGKRVDFSFVAKNFSTVSDEDISYNETDLRTYYKENIEKYRTDETRTLEYVVFDVVASEEDDANSKLWAMQTKNEFARTEDKNLTSYVNGISDISYDRTYYGRTEIAPLLRDSLLVLPEGEVFGPYYEDNAYKLSRISDIQMRPDSVRARHILIGYSVYGDVQRAKEIADSLYTVISNGGDFTAIAREYSSDESNRSIGGDLGWFTEGVMEIPFNNACFENKTGDVVSTETRYGIHIIRIENQSRPVQKMQIATIVHSVYPSNKTDQNYYNMAVKFRGKATNVEKFEEQAKTYGKDPRIVPDIARDQRTIPGLENPINMISWAYSAEEGDVSNIFDIQDQYIVAALTEVKEEGYASFDNVRDEVEVAVIKQKKGEMIASNMKESLAGATDINAFAATQNLEVSEASQVQFSNTFVSGIGLEPYIVGAAMNLPPESLAGPYIGENSVFVLSVTNRDQADPNAPIDPIEQRLNSSLQSRATYEAYEAMMKKADIEDNRLKVLYGR